MLIGILIKKQTKKMEKELHLEARIKEKKDDKAILLIEDQEVFLHPSKIPDHLGVGEKVKLKFGNSEHVERQELAKAILNQILIPR